jgi:hypothetical protein
MMASICVLGLVNLIFKFLMYGLLTPIILFIKLLVNLKISSFFKIIIKVKNSVKDLKTKLCMILTFCSILYYKTRI